MEAMNPEDIEVERIDSEGVRQYIVKIRENVHNARVSLAIDAAEGEQLAAGGWESCRWRDWRDCSGR